MSENWGAAQHTYKFSEKPYKFKFPMSETFHYYYALFNVLMQLLFSEKKIDVGNKQHLRQEKKSDEISAKLFTYMENHTPSSTSTTNMRTHFPLASQEQLDSIEENFTEYKNELEIFFNSLKFNALYDYYRHFIEQILKNADYHSWTGNKVHNSTRLARAACNLSTVQLLFSKYIYNKHV